MTQLESSLLCSNAKLGFFLKPSHKHPPNKILDEIETKI
jgi:hypothetical protein